MHGDEPDVARAAPGVSVGLRTAGVFGGEDVSGPCDKEGAGRQEEKADRRAS